MRSLSKNSKHSFQSKRWISCRAQDALTANHLAREYNKPTCSWGVTQVYVSQILKLDITSIVLSAPPFKLTDYVYIYDGFSTTAPLLVTLSGSMEAPLLSYVSSQQYVFIRFVSNNSVAYKGFNMTFESIEQGECIIYFVLHHKLSVVTISPFSPVMRPTKPNWTQSMERN